MLQLLGCNNGKNSKVKRLVWKCLGTRKRSFLDFLVVSHVPTVATQKWSISGRISCHISSIVNSRQRMNIRDDGGTDTDIGTGKATVKGTVSDIHGYWSNLITRTDTKTDIGTNIDTDTHTHTHTHIDTYIRVNKDPNTYTVTGTNTDTDSDTKTHKYHCQTSKEFYYTESKFMMWIPCIVKKKKLTSCTIQGRPPGTPSPPHSNSRSY